MQSLRPRLRTAWYLPLLTVMACGGGSDEPIDLTTTVTEPAPLPFIMSDAQLNQMEQDFSWDSTVELSELDPDGFPALHYAMIFVRTSTQARLLDDMKIHYESWPIFRSELDAPEEAIGSYGPGLDFDGSVFFAFIPAGIYNGLRHAALEGTDIYSAVVLRDIPEEADTHGSGAINYRWLAQEGFVYRSQDLDGQTQALSKRTQGIASRRQALGGLCRGVVALAQGIVNGIRMAASEVSEAFNGSRPLIVRLYVENTDPAFGATPMRSAWSRERMEMAGVTVNVGSGGLISMNSARTDELGIARMDIPANHRFLRVRVRMENQAAVLRNIYVVVEPLVFSGDVRGAPTIGVAITLRHVQANMLLQFADAHKLVTERLVTPDTRFRLPQVKVQTGALLAGLFPNAFAPCLSMFSDFNISATGFGGASLASAVSKIDDFDIAMSAASTDSRLVATHEYGHFVTCALINQFSGRDFSRVWGQVIENSLAQNDHPSGIVAEGIADFLASQIAGGTNYFGFSSDGRGSYRGAGYFCSADADQTRQPCMEDNVGGVRGAFPDGQQHADAAISADPRTVKIARIATLLHDVFDGQRLPTHFNNGGLWRFGSGDPEVLGVGVAGHGSDEAVALPAADFRRLFRVFSRDYNSLSGANFEEALAKTMLEGGVGALDVCQLMALHDRGGVCRNLPEGALDNIVLPPHEDVVLTARHDVRNEMPKATLSWRPGSVLPSPTRVICAGGAFNTDFTVPEGENTTEIIGLPFDEDLTCRVIPIRGMMGGELIDRSTHTPAEPVASLSGAPRPGGVEIVWGARNASAYRVRLIAPEARDLATTTEAGYVAFGLESETNYTIEVVSVDATGSLSNFASDPLIVTAGAQDKMYVSHSMGSDANSGITPGDPKQTLAAALEAIPADQSTSVLLEEGIFATGYVGVHDREIIFEGGMVVDAAGWTPGSQATTLQLSPAPGLITLAVNFGFNSALRDGQPGLLMTNSSVIIRNLNFELDGAAMPNACLIGLAAQNVDLVIEDAQISAQGTASCYVGLYARGGSGPNRLELNRTDIIGYQGDGNGSADTELAGLYAVGIDDVRIYGSSASAIRRISWGPQLQAFRMHGGYVVGARSVEASRSSFSTASGGARPNLAVAQLSGATFDATESITLDNSVFRGAEGSPRGTGLDAGSFAGLVTITMMNNTSVFGHSFTTPATLNDAGDLASAVRLFGYVRRIDMQNNLWVFARPGNWRFLEAVLDLNNLEARSQDGSRFVANVFSYPGPDENPGTRGGSKIMCRREGEFSESAVTDADLNNPLKYLCQTGGTAQTSDNLALFTNPGPGSAAERHGVELDAGGAPRPNNGDGTKSVLRNTGVALPSSLQSLMSIDRAGSMRLLSNPGVGAYIVP